MTIFDLLSMPGMTIFMFVVSFLIIVLGLVAYALERRKIYKKNQLKKLRALREAKA